MSFAMADKDISAMVYLSSGFSMFLYGIYTVLFAICVYMVIHRKGCVKKMHLVALNALFITGTLGFIFSPIETISTLESYRSNSQIWGGNRKIIVFPIIISTINNGLALVRLGTMAAEDQTSNRFMINSNLERADTLSQGILKSFLVVNFFTNLLIPLMIVFLNLTFLELDVSGGLDTKPQNVLD
ncbi:hypothetical protein K435DRAFT_799264 [Dendrothele bispora CBS 962.96]|uniref:Uncharacterized protein n=1 Tax=Dendrothele bispora (strain CBS 962.96) TaxID=1314807 RepID=A0A4S8LX46_DENBC|nr:hypothetical protein K435DRAFT_799264 [Dendrothele bispora CBS 962.96]